jgi:hypothetical protein
VKLWYAKAKMAIYPAKKTPKMGDFSVVFLKPGL